MMRCKYIRKIAFTTRFTLLFMTVLIAASVAIPATASAKEAAPVIISEVKRDRFVDRVQALGTLRANETVEVTANVTETVTSIRFDDGQRVNEGDILVEMTSEEEQALLEEAKSTHEEAKKQLARYRTLASRGAASRSVLDEQKREYETASARLKAIESRLKDRLILAPFSGVLGLRRISKGTLIEPGDLITPLDDDSVMKLDFSVPATFLGTLRTGIAQATQATQAAQATQATQAVKIVATSPAFGDRKFEGRVSAIDTRIDPSTRAVTVRAILPNPDRVLKPGLLMSVELLKNPRDALVIAEEALIPRGRENFVFVVDRSADEPKAERRRVTIGARRPGEVEILDGLAPGEYVVTHGTMKARPGEPVRIVSVERGAVQSSDALPPKLNRMLNPNQEGEV